MSENFVKLFSSIVHSSVWQEDAETRVVWVTLLALADADGYVGASVPGLARAACVSIEKTEEAMAKFMAPDPYSRNEEHQGRRLEKAPRGWRLLNYRAFRQRDAGAPSQAADDGRPGRMYFVRAGTVIKIGFSKNPWARLAEFKASSPVAPKLLGYVESTPGDVRAFQDRFKALRFNRDWFEATPELTAVIETLLADQPKECVATTEPATELRELRSGLQQEEEEEGEEDQRERSGSGSGALAATSQTADPEPARQRDAPGVAQDELPDSEPGSAYWLVSAFDREYQVALNRGPRKRPHGEFSKVRDWSAANVARMPPGERQRFVATYPEALRRFFRDPDKWVQKNPHLLMYFLNNFDRYERANAPPRSAFSRDDVFDPKTAM